MLRTADGETDKGRDGQPLSQQAKKLAPRGMVLVEWEPDPDRGETEATAMWLLLDPRPGKWNGDGHRAWRYHPAELAKMQVAKQQAKPAHAPSASAAGKRKACALKKHLICAFFSSYLCPYTLVYVLTKAQIPKVTRVMSGA